MADPLGTKWWFYKYLCHRRLCLPQKRKQIVKHKCVSCWQINANAICIIYTTVYSIQPTNSLSHHEQSYLSQGSAIHIYLQYHLQVALVADSSWCLKWTMVVVVLADFGCSTLLFLYQSTAWHLNINCCLPGLVYAVKVGLINGFVKNEDHYLLLHTFR